MRGDALARGARSATFVAQKKVSQAQWDAAFDDFDPEAFREKDGIATEAAPTPDRNLVKTGLK